MYLLYRYWVFDVFDSIIHLLTVFTMFLTVVMSKIVFDMALIQPCIVLVNLDHAVHMEKKRKKIPNLNYASEAISWLVCIHVRIPCRQHCASPGRRSVYCQYICLSPHCCISTYTNTMHNSIAVCLGTFTEHITVPQCGMHVGRLQ